MGQVFISYKSINRGFALHLRDKLLEAGLTVWIDVKDIDGGDDWQDKIFNEGLQGCEAVVLVICPEAMKSEWVNKEWQYAIENSKHLIPVHYYDTPNIPKALTDKKQLIDFRGQFNFEHLITCVKKKLGVYAPDIPENLPERIKEALRSILFGWKESDKIDALKVLAKAGHGETVDLIGQFLIDEDEFSLRILAIQTLVKIGYVRALTYIIRSLDDIHTHVQAEAIKAIGFLAEPDIAPKILANMLTSKSSLVYSTTLETLATIATEEAVRLILECSLEQRSYGGNVNIIELIDKRSLDQVAKPILVEWLSDEDPNKRATAAVSLRFLKDVSVVPNLVEHLDDPNIAVRGNMLFAIVGLDEAVALPYLLEAAKSDELEMRRLAARELGNLKYSQEITHELSRLKKDPDTQVHSTAHGSLIKQLQKKR